MAVRFSNPNTLAPPPGYSYVVDSQGPARVIYFAGQLGLDMENKLVGDFRAQCLKAFENMTLALKAADVSWSDVVKINNYLVDISATIPIFREVRDSFLNTKAPPASTTVGVPALARPGALFEIEAIAVVAAKGAGKPASRKPARKSKRRRR
jgi:enamine deaminase RidA (YjgF/YER057c/UK114 family)